MSRKCNLVEGKSVLSGNNVSHSKRKTRRKFLPNLSSYSLYSETLGAYVKFRASHSAIRSVEHNYGLDSFLFSKKDSELAPDARKVKKRILKAQAKKSAGTAEIK